ncbi:phage tail sheath subtilisin-like domain-containing protein [Sphingobium yanoikuyae]|uniref:phage tail sheath subtilisin-like domain-containing protein n=1 Tax=Sphingobium yanoikuyae TaxID=13690 RepID=UPI0026EA3282|nr:phage tail sheath subtilisin-like domain-containing protein [Sphingobium yanoikuyae]
MASIAFDAISSSQRVPGSQVEISNVRARQGLPPAQQKILLIGQCIGAASASAPVRMTRPEHGATLAGRGSILAAMVAAALAASTQVELWAMPIADNAAGVAATGTITLTGPSTAAGTLALMIAGVRIPVGVASGASATTIATAIAAAVNALPDLPVTASAAAAVVTLTCRHKGTAGNDIDVRTNYFDGESLPAGIGVTIVGLAGGATNPDLTSLLAGLGDAWYQTIVVGMNDAANMSVIDTDLEDRWGPVRQIEGRAYFGMSGSFSTLSTFGATRNGKHATIIGGYRIPSPPWAVAAAFAAIAAYQLQIDPARPLTALTVPGIRAPRPEHRFIRSERELLLKDGISTFSVNADGNVAIERLISCYQLSSAGFDDDSYLDVQTTATLGYYRYSYRDRMAAKFPRAKLTEETIASVQAETIALAREWEEAGLMEDVDSFISNLVIERDATNRRQLNTLMTPDTVNGLLQLATRIEFIL